jgi:putative transposase
MIKSSPRNAAPVNANRNTSKSSNVHELERKGYKFKLIVPNSTTEQNLTKFAGSCRFVWNKALALLKEDNEDYHTAVNMSITNGGTAAGINSTFKFNPYHQLSALLPKWKQHPETAFLADVYSKSLQITLEQLGQAIVEAKSKTNPKRYPVFKKRGIKDSFSFNGAIKHDAENGRIFIPKLGYLQYHKSREVPGIIKNVTISKHAGEWFVSLQSERLLSPVSPAWVNADKALGIDLGITKTISCSDAISFEYQGRHIISNQLDSISPFKKQQPKLARLQKDLARKIKFSHNWRKQKARIGILHSHIANTRNDFVHKVTTAISNNYAYVVVEDLQIQNMSKSAKGDILKPGTYVKQKAGLNRLILDQGWGMLRQFLTYKLKCNYNTELIEVNPHYTSQRCSDCGHTDHENRKNQASFQCMQCGMEMNADLNAALNVRTAGLAGIACGVDGVPCIQNAMLKQEPTESANQERCLASDVGILAT